MLVVLVPIQSVVEVPPEALPEVLLVFEDPDDLNTLQISVVKYIFPLCQPPWELTTQLTKDQGNPIGK